MNNLNELYEAILAGKLEQAVSVTREAVAGGAAPQEIINEYMIKAMEAIGARFESGQVFVPNLLMSARAMRGALDILKPLMQGQVNSYIGRIVIGTVKGDLHDIGKNLLLRCLKDVGLKSSIWEWMYRVINSFLRHWKIRQILFACPHCSPLP